MKGIDTRVILLFWCDIVQTWENGVEKTATITIIIIVIIEKIMIKSTKTQFKKIILATHKNKVI